MNRRTFVAIGMGATVGGASGCLATPSGADGTPADGTDATPTRTAGPTDDAPGRDDDTPEQDDDSDDSDGDDDDHVPGEDVEPISSPSGSAEVEMDSNGTHYFEPALVWIETGGTVVWENHDGNHTTTAYHADAGKPGRVPEGVEGWDSGLMENDQRFERTFETEGVYDYFCLPHEGLGMVGCVVVGNPDPEGQPGLAAPQSDLPERAREVLELLNRATRETLAGGG
ncbi:plastocyanin/azurin family copper-binding protein [Halorarum salinum]|uniref:Blue (type 1) copper domain-containing protein n=1 Tax=Halorarum salinum TaxID=2743089 RepID=A0A7D5QGQ9_9EURY|nr:plastocyanin/azurin family copper-binding protein [Halobaculum salinum]QLG64261.1 hypothetical protein HUG12_20990 [Halobaculum salinum]